MKKYTILYTIETGGPGGAENVLLNLASRLDPNRFRTLALLPEDGWLHQKLQQAGVPTVLVEWKHWYDLRLPRALVHLVRQEGVDLIHSHLPGQNFYSCLAGALTGRKTVVTYHGAVDVPAARLRTSIQSWWIGRAATAVVAVSDHLRDALMTSGFPANKVVRIYNGIDTGRFGVSGRGTLRAELGCVNGARLVGTVANFRQSKGYDYFVRAARRVADAIPEVHFVAVGEVDREIAPRLSQLLRELSLEERFSMVGFREDVPQILNDLDVFVLCSTSEGFSLAAVEAMAAGRPVVATRCGGPEEIIADGHTGLLVPPADPETLAARICELLLDPRRASALAENARHSAEARFSLAAMVREHERLYDRCLGPG